MMKKTIITIFAILLALNLSSAIVINSVDTPTLTPSEQGQIRIEIENIFTDDAENVLLSLDFKGLPFIPIGSSQQSIDKIEEDDEETFVFAIKASSDIKPGDYEIPYVLEYELNSNEKSRAGTIGVKVRANPELIFSVDTKNPVENKQGQVILKIVNKGFADARFVTVKVLSDGLTLLSDDEEYIGTVDSDDFETLTFDVIFKKTNPNFEAIINYKDFDNVLVTKTINLPIEVYTQEKALELGIIKPSYTFYYVGGGVAIIVLYLIYRSIKKRRRLKRSMANQGR